MNAANLISLVLLLATFGIAIHWFFVANRKNWHEPLIALIMIIGSIVMFFRSEPEKPVADESPEQIINQPERSPIIGGDVQNQNNTFGDIFNITTHNVIDTVVIEKEPPIVPLPEVRKAAKIKIKIIHPTANAIEVDNGSATKSDMGEFMGTFFNGPGYYVFKFYKPGFSTPTEARLYIDADMEVIGFDGNDRVL
ncbi:MAG: hypothetical protein KDC34_03415 [Saprospiraceae bacterium]|nr:hypothetical protein [Saprospiraceae bacterium]